MIHAALLGFWIFTYEPDATPVQPTPKGELDIQAYELDRTEAPERQPDMSEAAPADADPVLAQAGGVTRVRARTAEPKPISAVNSTLPTDAISPTAPETEQPGTVAISAPVLEEAAVLLPELPESAVLPSEISEAPADLKPVSSGDFQPVSAANANPSPRPVVFAPKTGTAVSSAKPQSNPAAQLRQDAEQITAALALDGGGDGAIDPLSVSAFQSFMRPGDLVNEADPLRDGVAALLSGVPCARLQVAFDPDSATLQLNGHLPDADLRAPVLAALQAQMGSDIGVSDNMLILPRPQCGALSGIANVGLPQSTDQITNPLLIGDDTQARVLNFVKDDQLFFDLTAPEYDAYVYVDYFDAAGNVLHLAPNETVTVALVSADSAFRVGAKTESDDGLQIFIGPPFGQEIAVAFAASSPIYEGIRPLVEPAAPYLEWLKARVALARETDPAFKGEWVYFFVTTAAK